METFTPTGKQRKFTADNGEVFHLEQVLETSEWSGDEISWQLVAGELHFRMRRVDDPHLKWSLEGANSVTREVIGRVARHHEAMAHNMPRLLTVMQRVAAHHATQSA